MSIKDILEKIKPFYTLILGLVLASIFFALGRLSMNQTSKSPIKIEYNNPALVLATEAEVPVTTSTISTTSIDKIVPITNQIPIDGNVIGSKTGKKYYFPWCGTVKRIKAENQVFFRSISEAKSAGFTPGGNCKGLK